jgi:hypothetical protein
LNLLCVLWLVPETKGRTLEDITRFWTTRGLGTRQAKHD